MTFKSLLARHVKSCPPGQNETIDPNMMLLRLKPMTLALIPFVGSDLWPSHLKTNWCPVREAKDFYGIRITPRNACHMGKVALLTPIGALPEKLSLLISFILENLTLSSNKLYHSKMWSISHNQPIEAFVSRWLSKVGASSLIFPITLLLGSICFVWSIWFW